MLSAAHCLKFLQSYDGRVLFSTDSPGTPRAIRMTCYRRSRSGPCSRVSGWQAFLRRRTPRWRITIAPLDNGVLLPDANSRDRQRATAVRRAYPKARKRKRRTANAIPETIIRQLNDLEEGLARRPCRVRRWSLSWIDNARSRRH